MAVRTREEILSQITAKFGGDTSDDVIALMEDVTDTLTDLEAKVSGDGKDWKAEAERIDKEWREKYISRFQGGSTNNEELEEPTPIEEKTYSFENLFKEGE